MKKFLIHMLERVDYFQRIGEDAIHDIIYSLENHFYDTGEYLQKPGDTSDMMYFVLEGQVEVYTKFENLKFVIENLYKGSIINYRLFFMKEPSKVFMKFTKRSIIL